jgi:hypothetical protein
MRLLNGLSAVIREKSNLGSGSIILPDTKFSSSKVAICLQTSKKKKKGVVFDAVCKAGDRLFVLQYDQGYPIPAHEDMVFEIDRDSFVTPERLPEGVELKGDGHCDEGGCLTTAKRLHVKKGTMIQYISDDVIQGILETMDAIGD